MQRRITARLARLASITAIGGLLLSGCSAASDDGAEPESLRVWFMQDSAPQESLDWLEEAWAERHPDIALDIEIQSWDGILEKLQTALASESETPDLVEIGNTDVSAFSTYGALTDISDMREEIGGDSLVPSLVDSGSVDGTLYAAPLYAGSRIVYYRPSLFEAAGLEVPTTIQEFVDTAVTLQEANPEDVDGFSGIYMTAKDTGATHSILFSNGANYAAYEDGEWTATLDAPEATTALEQMAEIWQNGTTAAMDTLDQTSQQWVPFNEGRAGMFIGMGFAANNIDESIDWDVFTLPGVTSDEPGHAFAGGSNVAIPAQSSNQDLAKELLQLVMSEDFLEPFASVGGWVPGNVDYGTSLNETAVGAASLAATETSAGTPASPSWGVVESTDVIRNFYTQIATGADLTTAVESVQTEIEDLLNR